jgi:hypothetical protein
MFDFDVITGPGPLAALAAKQAERDALKKPDATAVDGKRVGSTEVDWAPAVARIREG